MWANSMSEKDDDHSNEEHGHDAHDNAKWIGLALLAGFLVM